MVLGDARSVRSSANSRHPIYALLGQSDPRDRVVRNALDRDDELAVQTINDGGARNAAYDAYGSQTTTYDGPGSATSSAYDKADRFISVTAAV